MFLGFVTAIVMFFLPMAGFSQKEGGELIYQFLDYAVIQDMGIKLQSILIPLIMNAVVALVLLINIFLYKNRKIQKRILLVLMVLNLATLGSTFFVADQIESLTSITSAASYKLGIYAPLLIMMFIVFANRGIRKDDKLVSSADRLR
jgi:hypothetical protein